MCDTLCIRHEGGMWFAKNSDRNPREVQTFAWHAARAAGSELRTQYLTVPDADAFAFAGSQPTWLWGCEHGVNERGVAVGNEKIWTTGRPKSRPAALLGMDIVRLVLERARTADEALEVCTGLVERYGQGGSGEPFSDEPYDSSFLLVDSNAGWIVETCDRTWVARPVGDGAAISNRISLTTDWTRASEDVAPDTNFDTFRKANVPTAIADGRLATTRACVATGEPTLATIAATMRDHGGRAWPDDFSVCMHCSNLDAQTTASMIANIGNDGSWRAWVCLGNPCTSVYVPILPGGVAAELADPAQWERFARLRDAVEREPERLVAVRAELDPVEHELWATAENLTAASVFAPVDAALHRLGV
jgi:hypothetical protein